MGMSTNAAIMKWNRTPVTLTSLAGSVDSTEAFSHSLKELLVAAEAKEACVSLAFLSIIRGWETTTLQNYCDIRKELEL